MFGDEGQERGNERFFPPRYGKNRNREGKEHHREGERRFRYGLTCDCEAGLHILVVPCDGDSVEATRRVLRNRVGDRCRKVAELQISMVDIAAVWAVNVEFEALVLVELQAQTVIVIVSLGFGNGLSSATPTTGPICDSSSAARNSVSHTC